MLWQSHREHRNDSTKLTYYIWEGLLVGLLAGKPIEMSAAIPFRGNS
jgi:hypothetical protein